MTRNGEKAERGDDGLKSLTKIMRVLECYSALNRSLTLGEICKLTGLPKSTTHRLVASMRDVGLLDQTREGERYRLGLRLFELGNTVLTSMDLHREARPFVESLTRLSGQVVHLAVFDGLRAVVIHSGSSQPDGIPGGYVEPAPAYCTSVGKAILAHQAPPILQRFLSSRLKRFTDTTITDPAVLEKELALVRTRGYSVDEGEHQPGLRCIGAPIRDAGGRTFAAISVSGPSWKIQASDVPSMAKVVMHSAQAISTALGYRQAEEEARVEPWVPAPISLTGSP